MATYTDPTTTTTPTLSPSIQPGGNLTLIPLFLGLAALWVVASSGYLYWQLQQHQQQITNQTVQLSQRKQSLTQLQPVVDDLTFYTDAAAGFHTLFDNQKRWEDILTTIENHLYRNMTLTSFNLGSDGSFQITGTVPDFTSYARLSASLVDTSNKSVFRMVKPNSVSKNDPKTTGSGVSFSFTITLDPSVLAPNFGAPPTPSTPSS